MSEVPQFETVQLVRKGRRLDIVLNRPDAMNAVNLQLHDELAEALHFARIDTASDVIVLTGSTPVLAYSIPAPPGAKAHAGLGQLGPPRLDVFRAEFQAASRLTGVDESWLRAIAHVESGFDANAVSPKGAQGVMQLMPDTAAAWQVTDPFNANQSIQAGARELRQLSLAYAGELARVAAAYKAGAGTVAKYGGMPPYAETQQYVANVLELNERYRAALAKKPRAGQSRR